MTISAFSFGLSAHLAALCLLAVQACAGARLLARLDGQGLRAHERLLFGWAAGFSLTTACLMLLTLAGGLSGITILVALAGLAVFGWPVARELGADTARVFRATDAPTKLTLLFELLVLAVWQTPLFAETLLPNSDWDAALYHLPLAERCLDGMRSGTASAVTK